MQPIHTGNGSQNTGSMLLGENVWAPGVNSSFLLGLDVAAILPCNAQLHLLTLLLLVFRILLVVQNRHQPQP